MAVVFDKPEPAESGDTGLAAVDVDRGRFRLVLALLLAVPLPALAIIGGTVFVVERVIKLVASFWQ
jgi:hypothetical protein